jgi:hypothetical protein
MQFLPLTTNLPGKLWVLGELCEADHGSLRVGHVVQRVLARDLQDVVHRGGQVKPRHRVPAGSTREVRNLTHNTQYHFVYHVCQKKDVTNF